MSPHPLYPIEGPPAASLSSSSYSASTTDSSPVMLTPVETPTRTAPAASQLPAETKKEGSDLVAATDEPDHPTDSHMLANTEVEEGEKGVAQLAHPLAGGEVRDLGWSAAEREALSRESQACLEPPLGSSGVNGSPPTRPRIVGGLDNAELWTLVRRFNKQLYHVKAVDRSPLGGLDLEIAAEEEFSPDKLRANVERLYMTVVVGSVGAWKHVARLRSWRERNRTLAFMGVYALAWTLDLLVPMLVAFMLVLILVPRARTACFPPAPIALIDAKTGGIKKPTAGVLGSDNSLTGAPEKHQGEAVEAEASNFVNSFTAIAISSAAGKEPKVEDKEDDHGTTGLEAKAVDPADFVHGLSDAKTITEGGSPQASHDKTKEPMSAAMWSKTRPVMHALADIADGWERFGNALSPTPPFPKDKARMKLAAVLLPVLGLSLFVTPYMMAKGAGAGIGFAFFGNPLIWRGLAYMDRRFPHWQKILEIRNTLLKGVPTNAQLTLTLLRIGEANKAPLPPPPFPGPPPPDAAHANAGKDLEHLNVPEEELASAIHPDMTSTSTGTSTSSTAPKKRHGSKILSTIKGITKGGVETLFSADKLKASIGSEHAKNRLGVVTPDLASTTAGPVRFPARFRGHKGHAFITTTATTPALSWTSDHHHHRHADNDATAAPEPAWSVRIDDIAELKKVGGLGWKAKMVVGWALERGVKDGLLVVERGGVARKLTALSMREELFNRLVAIGGQVWEAW